MTNEQLELADHANLMAECWHVLIKTEACTERGIYIYTRRNKYCRWYRHGAFGTDSAIQSTRDEIEESMYQRYGH